MKYNLNGVLIVEGKEDVSYLSSFIDGLFFTTNGLDISSEKINFLKEVKKVNNMIILTDNDDSGLVIRKKIESEINGCFDIEISGKSRKNYKKKGVAESNKEELINLLSKHFTKEHFMPFKYNLNKHLSLNKNGKILKQKIIQKYRLINGNNKYLENQLNMLKIEPSEIDKFMEENEYDNQ